MLSRKAGRAQVLTAASLKYLHPSCVLPNPQDTRRSIGPASPDSSICEGGIPHSCYQTLHLSLPSKKAHRSHCPCMAWGNGSPAQSPQEVYCCHHQEAHGVFQTSSQEAEARVPFFPVRSPSTQQPLLPQALTSQHQHCSFSFKARGRTQCHLCCKAGLAAHASCAELPGTSMAGFASSNLQGGPGTHHSGSPFPANQFGAAGVLALCLPSHTLCIPPDWGVPPNLFARAAELQSEPA